MADIFDFYVQDDRKISFEIAEPIMLEDNHVTDWVFHIPKSLNGFDMSAWAWWLVYVNARNEKFSERLVLSDDPERPTEYNIATYSVDYGMSIKAGNISFAVEAINADTGGTVTNEWHTYTYQTKVKETLQGNQVEYAETESDIISALLIDVRNKINQLVGGATPLPVSSISEMVDTTKVYILTTDKNWYLYNGSAWVSGGVYGAGVQIDSTLTKSGQAAGAKEVGDKIGEVKEDLKVLSSDVNGYFERNEELVNGYRVSNGSYIRTTVNASNIYRTALFPVSEYGIVDVGGKGSATSRTWATCDANYNVMRTATAEESQVFDTYSIEILPGEKYFCFNSVYTDANPPYLNHKVCESGLKVSVTNLDAQEDSQYKKGVAISQESILTKEGYFYQKTIEKDVAKYCRVSKVGSAVWKWSQVNKNTGSSKTVGNVVFTNNKNGTWAINGTKSQSDRNIQTNTGYSSGIYFFVAGHKYFLSTGDENVCLYGMRYNKYVGVTYKGNRQIATAPAQTGSYDYLVIKILEAFYGDIDTVIRPICVDLTEMFGAGNEPTINDTEVLNAIEVYAANNPTIYSAFIETIPTAVQCGGDIHNIPDIVKQLQYYGSATQKRCNYISYDEWSEGGAIKHGWRYHKNVGRVVLNGTQPIRTSNFKPTDTTSAWIYYNIGEKPQPTIRALGDVLSDVLTPVSYAAIYNAEVTDKPVIALYTDKTYGFSVRVPVAGIDTTAKINEYMTQNPAIVLFELDAEEIYDISVVMPAEIIVSTSGDYLEFSNTSGIGILGCVDFYSNVVKGNVAMLTIIDDDGDKHFLTDVVPMILRKNIPISSAVTPVNVGKVGFMTYEEIDECNDSGAEILCHTYDHPDDIDPHNFNALEVTHKYLRGLNILKRHGYHASDILVYTSSTGTYKFYQECAAKVFKAGIRIGGETLNYPYTDKFALARYRCDYAASEGRTDWNYDDLKGFVDECADKKGWMIWMFHTSNSIYKQRVELNPDGSVKKDTDGNPIPMTNTEGKPVIDINGENPTMGSEVYLPMLEDLIDYAVESGVEIATASQAYEVYFG